jgi:hypothetical protein
MGDPVISDRLKVWRKAFASDDANSIVNQVYMMTWNMAAFQVVNEARRIAIEEQKRGVNSLLHNTFDDCFFLSQFATYRRLNDKKRLHGGDGVWSLRSILFDIRRCNSRLTRRILVEEYGYEYDFSEIDKRHEEWIIDRARESGGSYCGWVPRELNSHPSKHRHGVIDELCGVAQKNRSPNDVPDVRIVDGLLRKLDLLEPACTYADKFIAHASSVDSRTRSSSELEITLSSLLEMQKTVSKVVVLLDRYFIDGGYTQHLAVPQYDQFQYLDEPLIRSTDSNTAIEAWNRYDEMIRSWSEVDLDWVK